MTQTICKQIEENQHKFLDSEIAIFGAVKRDGKMCLQPKAKEPDSLLTRIKQGKPFNFCVKIVELHKATV